MCFIIYDPKAIIIIEYIYMVLRESKAVAYVGSEACGSRVLLSEKAD